MDIKEMSFYTGIPKPTLYKKRDKVEWNYFELGVVAHKLGLSESDLLMIAKFKEFMKR